VEAQRKPDDGRALLVVGVVLLTIGIAALVAQFTPNLGQYFPLALGFVLLAIFAATRAYVALVFGGIFSGIGGGLVAAELLSATGEAEGGLVVLGLGLGFFGIAVTSALLDLKESHWWPLVPGSILSLIGLGLLVSVFDQPLVGPIVLVGVGLLLIAVAYFQTRRPHSTA
jgi:hypothetical protein